MWEIDSGQQGGVKVQGGLRRHFSFWVDTSRAPDHIIDAIKHGYVLPLFSHPTPYYGANHKSAIDQSDFVTRAVQELLDGNCISKAQ